MAFAYCSKCSKELDGPYVYDVKELMEIVQCGYITCDCGEHNYDHIICFQEHLISSLVTMLNEMDLRINRLERKVKRLAID